MPRFQLEASFALAAVALGSLVVLAANIPRTGKVRLEDDSHDLAADPFDVTTPEDMTDGEPVDEGAFWASVSQLCICATAFNILTCGVLGPIAQDIYNPPAIRCRCFQRYLSRLLRREFRFLRRFGLHHKSRLLTLCRCYCRDLDPSK